MPHVQASSSSSTAPASVPFATALRFWLKLGFISFGGPAGQIALMHEELVTRRKWVDEARFQHALVYCMTLPGPEAQQLATYCGWLLHGRWGGLAAGVLFVLPSFFALSLLAYLSLAFAEVPAWEAITRGLGCAVVALLAHALWRMGRRSWQGPWQAAISLAAFAATYFADIAFPWVLFGAMLLGFIVPEKILPVSKLAQPSSDEVGQDARVGQVQKPKSRKRELIASTLRTFAIFLALFSASFLAVVLTWGWEHVLAKVSWFFTQCAWITFGGAYVVLPFVTDYAVNHQGWLTMEQMMHGLAMGETTPGPLIMVVTYVGFLAGGWMGATAATWFTFLPSFFFIFAGAPWLEATRGLSILRRPLFFVPAAALGPMLALALVFAEHAFWPSAQNGRTDFFAVFLSLALTALLGHKRMTVPWLILLGGLIGLAWS